MVVFMDSQDFKVILDYMTADEILGVWNYFSDEMSSKFLSGLTHEDIMAMTSGEWQASYIAMDSTQFKNLYFDQMTT